MALGFAKLKDWKLRQRPDLKVKAIAGRSMRAFSQINGAMVFAFPPPPVIELGQALGFDFQLQDRGGLGHDKLMAARNQLLGMAAKDPRLVRVRPNGMEDVAEYHVDVDWDKAGALGISINSIHNTIAAAFGSAYVNDFIQAGRVKKVFVQADASYRMLPKDLEKLYVRNSVGKMVPFSSFASSNWVQGSPKLERYNAFPSINIWGEPTPGHSTGEAMAAMEEIASRLPQGIGFDWTGLSYQQRMATAQGPILYAFSIFVIFLCVAALYESWTIPFVNLLMLPLGVLGAIIATSLRGMPNDVYFQIGFLTTLGLSTKNAILIIQLIKERLRHGDSLIDATLGAVKIRVRLGSVAVKLLQALTFIPILIVGQAPAARKILLSVDASPASMKAVEFVAALLGGHGYEACIFHAIPSLGSIHFDLSEICRLELSEVDMSDTCLEAFKLKVARLFQDVKVKLMTSGFESDKISEEVIFGVRSRSDAIVKEAEEGGFGTIVVGRRGLSKVEAIFMGRVGHEVVYGGSLGRLTTSSP